MIYEIRNSHADDYREAPEDFPLKKEEVKTFDENLDKAKIRELEKFFEIFFEISCIGIK